MWLAPPPCHKLPRYTSSEPAGIAIDWESATVDGRQLTVGFVGAPLSGAQACGSDYTAEGVESPLAVVVIVTAQPNAAGSACDPTSAPRTASVTLAAPLGDRTVLEVTQGRPIPVRLTP